MVHILLLGATGRTGRIVLKEALRRGHTVTALVRNPAALDGLAPAAGQSPHLTVMRGSALNPAELGAAVATAVAAGGGDGGGGGGGGGRALAVLCTLNPRRTSDNPFAAPHPTDSPPRMMADSIRNVLAALAALPGGGAGEPAAPRHKVVHLSALGAGDSLAQTPFLFRLLVKHSNMKLAYADHEAVEDELRRAVGVAWVSVRPSGLMQGAEGDVVKVWPKENGKVGMMATSSKHGVAKFMVDAAEKPDWDGQAVVVLS